MGFKSTRELISAEDTGATHISAWRKAPTQTTASGFWFDLSMSPGFPSPQYYAANPLTTRVMSYSSDGGIHHGLGVSPSKRILRKISAMTNTATVAPAPMILLDYLMYYPFVEETVDGPQTMTNSSTLTRYTNGLGVMIMPVIVAPGSGLTGVTFTCSYTNSSGVPGRTTQQVELGTQIVNGTVAITSSATAGCNGPFVPLQRGDVGVRSIESVTFNGVADVGLITLVLVKPVAQLSIREVTSPVEVDYLVNFANLPEIKDDAYLNLIVHPGGTIAGSVIMGMIESSWG
jgi:hypothetical protein